MRIYPPRSIDRLGLPRLLSAPISSRRSSSAGTTGSGDAYSGAGSPEGSQAADVGSTYVETSTLRLWFKTSGSGDTGWTPQPRASVGTGSPEGAVSGRPGDTYFATDISTLYFKASGVDTNTGWA